MSDYWKLKIKDYTLFELQNLFSLKDPYTMEDVINSDLKLTNRIKTDDTIDAEKKKQILVFLNKAKERLVHEQKKEMAHMTKTPLHPGNDHAVQKVNNNNTDLNKQYIPGQAPFSQINLKGVPLPVYKKVLAINTQFRDNYYKTRSTDFLLNLPTKLSQVVAMELTGLELPYSYYQISKELGNDYFWIGLEVQSKPLGSRGILQWYYIQIAEGNYDGLQTAGTNWQKEITAQMVSIMKNTGSIVSPEFIPTCGFNLFTHRTIFMRRELGGLVPITELPISFPSPSSAPNLSIHLAFNRGRGGNTVTEGPFTNPPPIEPRNISKNLGWLLGYRMAEYKASSAYISEGVIDDWGMRYLYVIVDCFNKNFVNTVEPVYNSSLGRDNILARISLPAGAFSKVGPGLSLATQFDPGDFVRNYFGPVDIEKLRFTITDEYGRVVNLNNMDLSMTVTMTCLYG